MGLKVLSGVMVIHAIFAIPKLATLTSLGTDIGYGLAAFVGVFIVAELALAYGFWTLKTWAYNGGMIILGIEFIFNVVTISLFSAILLGFVLGYLRSKQRIFRY